MILYYHINIYFLITNFYLNFSHGYDNICLAVSVETSRPHGLGHVVVGIKCVLDRTNVGSILLATVGAPKRLLSEMVGASKRLLSDMYLILCMLYGQL